ncbi:hypothetical protein [Haloparvum sedimenti]|uniref:hypothetical protein n=1 Tax=Haloparvum sedimenti TaxID=1678448 RepID=UPI00071E8A36|nr:hypothetical protein [Haloparvum sedimenti]
MGPNEYRERYASVRKRHRDLRNFVENSRHADRENVVSLLNDQTAVLETIEELLETYETVIELTDDHEEKLARLQGRAETLDAVSDGDLTEAIKAERAESRELEAMIDTAGEQLEQRLDRIERNVTELGKTLATTEAYDPTAETGDDIAPTEKATLDDILRDVSQEGDDWDDG